jgi:uncharacterized protein DUF4430
VRRAAALLVAAAVVAGCGAGETTGTASVWVSRERGEKVVLVRQIPAGLTAMQALRRVADVKTRFGGRFVQAINGIEGSLSARRDWFYFVNGYEADRGAAEYRLQAGDVEWWDYRSWATPEQEHVPVVVGAFPEPFVHGYAGKRRPAVVVSRDRRAGRALAKVLRARLLQPGASVPQGANVFLYFGRGPTRFTAAGSAAGSPVRFEFSGSWRRLLGGAFRYRYEVRS